MPHGSPLWQGAIFLFAIIFLYWEMWRGWRAGFVRSGLNLAAMVVSALVLYFGGLIAAAPFGGMTTTAGFFAGLVVGTGLALAAFALIWLLGALLFKRTEHQGSGLVRLFWGLGGAVFGLILGLFLLWGGISIVRTLGILAESRLATAPSPTIEPIVPPGEPPPPPPPAPYTQRVANGLVTLKKSLELGSPGKFVESVDVLPPDFYQLVLEVGKVANSQESMLRFIQYPGIQKVLQSPRMAELLADPSVIRASEERNYMALMSNKALIAAVEDPALAEQLKQIDIRAALKFALETTPASPSPSPQSSP